MGGDKGEFVSFSGIPKVNVTNKSILQTISSKRKIDLHSNNDNNYNDDDVVP